MDLACVTTRHMLYSLPIELHFNFSLINLICDWGCASSQILRMSINSLDGCLVCHMCCYRLLVCHADQSIKRQRGAGGRGRAGTPAGSRQDSAEGAAWSRARASVRSINILQSRRRKMQRRSSGSHHTYLKATALFQITEANYRHIKIIIRLAKCLLSGAGNLAQRTSHHPPAGMETLLSSAIPPLFPPVICLPWSSPGVP